VNFSIKIKVGLHLYLSIFGGLDYGVLIVMDWMVLEDEEKSENGLDSIYEVIVGCCFVGMCVFEGDSDSSVLESK